MIVIGFIGLIAALLLPKAKASATVGTGKNL
jgi:hypothetical protein